MKVNPNRFGYTQVKQSEPSTKNDYDERSYGLAGFKNAMNQNSIQYAANYRMANQLVDRWFKDQPAGKSNKYGFWDWFANLFPYCGGEVSDKGMKPTLDVGWDVKGTRSKRQYKRYSVVFCVAYNPKKQYKEMILRRVIGLPGETVSLHEDGHISINGELLKEPYIKKYHKRDVGVNYHLGKHEYFVLCDNRNYDFDSRTYGPIKRSQIKHNITSVLRSDSSVFEPIEKLSGF